MALRGGAASPVLAFNATELGFADAEAAASLGLAPGVMVGVTVALVTQGVSLEQSWASLWQNNLGAQRELNEIALNALAGYAKKVHAAATTALGAPASPRAAALQQQQQALLERARRLHAEDEPKNVELLLSVAMLTRSLRGGRLTMCKSGKDRTSMSVTLEHGRLLRDHHGLDDAEATHAVGVLRRHGVRREPLRRNMGSRCYAFNDAQQWFLPPALQPPKARRAAGRRERGHKMSCLRSKVMTPRRPRGRASERFAAAARRGGHAPAGAQNPRQVARAVALPVAEVAAGAAAQPFPRAAAVTAVARATPTPPGRGLAPQRAQDGCTRAGSRSGSDGAGGIGAVRFGATGTRGRRAPSASAVCAPRARGACGLQQKFCCGAPSASRVNSPPLAPAERAQAAQIRESMDASP